MPLLLPNNDSQKNGRDWFDRFEETGSNGKNSIIY